MNPTERPAVYRYGVPIRLSHWVWVIAFFVLVGSGLQIFNASPNLDASDKSDPARRVLAIGSPQDGVGTTTIFGHTFVTTGWLGWNGNGYGGQDAHAFPAIVIIPGYQDLAAGRRWHFFFAWIAALCWIVWVVSTAVRRPPAGVYNPVQKASYIIIGLVIAPLVVLTGLALSPGIDAIANPLTAFFGGRQFARLWHFTGMLLLLGFFAIHVFQVLTHNVLNQMRSMITGWYRIE